jgi:hypothetical protein
MIKPIAASPRPSPSRYFISPLKKTSKYVFYSYHCDDFAEKNEKLKKPPQRFQDLTDTQNNA